MKNFPAICLLTVLLPGNIRAADSVAPAKTLASALSPEKWSQVQSSVDRGLAWLASQQEPDGSFPTLAAGQPAVTSLCVMAFLSRGHLPGFGPYGQQLNRAIDYVLTCQKEDGLFCHTVPEPDFHEYWPSHTAAYNHPIAGLMLAEVYGHVTGQRAKKVRAAITKAISFTRALQTRPKPYADDEGGLRYIRQKPGEPDSDLSITACHLMFLRSAKNAEFDVPQKYMDEGIAYIRRCWNPSKRMFNYYGGYGASHAMTGAGIVSLSMAGEHNNPMTRAAGDWLVEHPFGTLGESFGSWDRYLYSTYYCSQAAAQLGGHYWEKIFPPILEVYLQDQAADGSFPCVIQMHDAVFGNAYSTAMAVLAMTPAYQLLPVYQR